MNGSTIGQRIHVIGMSSSGKSTLGERLARLLDVPFVELDALNWEPGWVGLNETDPEELERRIREATAGDGWVVAGSYARFCQRTFWPRLHTIVWLDLPMPQLLFRAVRRSWRRWRTGELLWGTNRESFWRQMRLWDPDSSLVAWIATQHGRKREAMLAAELDPAWRHIRFIRLTSTAEVDDFLRLVESP